MDKKKSASDLIAREFLPTRAKILEIAASLDRVTRSLGDNLDDPRWSQIAAAMQLLLDEKPDRAERIQLLFSRDYDEDWRKTFGLK